MFPLSSSSSSLILIKSIKSTKDNSKPLIKIPRVVIVGGGYAGCLLAHTLEEDVKNRVIDLYLIDRKETFHHRIGGIRAQILGGTHIDRVMIPLQEIVKCEQVIVGEVIKIDPTSQIISFANPSITPNVSYDVLICATGSGQAGPADLPLSLTSKDEIRNFFNETSSNIVKSNSVVIIGGGASAIELAFEIRHAYRDKQITIIASASHFFSTMVSPVSSKFLAILYQKLKDNNIQTIMGEKVIEPSWQSFQHSKFLVGNPILIKTQGDQNIQMTADLVIWAATYRVKSNFYPQSWLNNMNEIAINDAFQQFDYPNVFATGDVEGIPETKMALSIPKKMPILRFNILQICKIISNHPSSTIAATTINETTATTLIESMNKVKLKYYTPREYDTFVLPFGPSDGLIQKTQFKFFWWRNTSATNLVVLGGKKASQVKGKDLYTTMWFKLLTGQLPPPVQ
jgi:NADH dehydrogenase FAD-containing subunit